MNWAETIPFVAVLYVVVCLAILLVIHRRPPDRRRRANRIAWASIVFGLLAGIAIVPHSRYWIIGNLRSEKEVDGHHISFWRYQIRNGRDYDRAMAYGALYKLGPEAKPAVPELIARLKDPSWQTNKNETTNPVAWVLAKIGPAAKDAIPALVESLAFERNTKHTNCADALIAIGSESIPSVIPLLHHPDLRVRYDAAYVLNKFGYQAKDAVPELVKLIGDPALRAVNYEFGKKETLVWITAVEALGNIGPDAKDAIPILAADLLERPQHFNLIVWTALAKIDVKNAEAIMACAGASGHSGLAAPQHAFALVGALRATDPHIRELAALIVGADLEIGSNNSVLYLVSVIPGFRAALRDACLAAMKNERDSISHIAAALYLKSGNIAPGKKENEPFIQADLVQARRLLEKAISPAQPNAQIRSRAINALCAKWSIAGKQAIDEEPYLELRKTVPALIRALGDTDVRVRILAVIALEARGVPPEHHDDLMEGLCKFLAAPANFPPLIHPQWGATHEHSFRLACQFIVQGGERAKPLVTVLVRLLEEGSRFRTMILGTLAALGPNAKDALLGLRKLAADKDPQKEIAAAIRAIEGKK